MASRPGATPPDAVSLVRTLPELFAWRVAETARAVAYRYWDATAEAWVEVSWGEMAQRIATLRVSLAALDLPEHARVAILLPNGVDAVCTDQAALALGYVPVPMHALDNPASIAYILADSEASFLILADDGQWRAIAETGTRLPALRHVVAVERTFPDRLEAGGVPVLLLREWLARPASVPVGGSGNAPLASDLAALVYTSGTTGKPKGVMLTHENVVSNVKAAMLRIAPLPGDLFLSFLPLSHTFERTAGYYLPIASGACVAFARSTKHLTEDLKSVRPTILVSVPRIYERALVALQHNAARSFVTATLFSLAQAVGWRRFRRSQGLLSDGRLLKRVDAVAWPLLDMLVGQRVREAFGGRLRLAVSGGAALSPAVARCFLGLGLPIVQGYGMTETSPIVSANGLDDNDPATVGRLLAGVAARIGDNQELLVRGPNVMRGYWKRDEDTARAFVDGWLRTGDQAAVEAGRVHILGRLKEVIVTSTGEKVAPVDLELAITSDRSFEFACVFGDDHPFIGCVVVLSQGYWASLTARFRLDPEAAASLRATLATDAVLGRIRDLTSSFPFYAQPRGVVLSLEPWTVESTLMTPTLKLKRNNIAKRFESDIAALYAAREH